MADVGVVDLRLALEVTLGIASMVMGWFVRMLFERIKAVEVALQEETKAVNDLRVVLPTNYVSKQDFREMGDNIFGALRRIEDKMDRKADKP